MDTLAGMWATVRSDVLVRSGQWHFELVMPVHEATLVGVCAPQFMQLAERKLGEDAFSWAVQPCCVCNVYLRVPIYLCARVCDCVHAHVRCVLV